METLINHYGRLRKWKRFDFLTPREYLEFRKVESDVRQMMLSYVLKLFEVQRAQKKILDNQQLKLRYNQSMTRPISPLPHKKELTRV
jgi:hypothetical protein